MVFPLLGLACYRVRLPAVGKDGGGAVLVHDLGRAVAPYPHPEKDAIGGEDDVRLLRAHGSALPVEDAFPDGAREAMTVTALSHPCIAEVFKVEITRMDYAASVTGPPGVYGDASPSDASLPHREKSRVGCVSGGVVYPRPPSALPVHIVHGRHPVPLG